jgi:hypothetical protein
VNSDVLRLELRWKQQQQRKWFCDFLTETATRVAEYHGILLSQITYMEVEGPERVVNGKRRYVQTHVRVFWT